MLSQCLWIRSRIFILNQHSLLETDKVCSGFEGFRDRPTRIVCSASCCLHPIVECVCVSVYLSGEGHVWRESFIRNSGPAVPVDMCKLPEHWPGTSRHDSGVPGGSGSFRRIMRTLFRNGLRKLKKSLGSGHDYHDTCQVHINTLKQWEGDVQEGLGQSSGSLVRREETHDPLEGLYIPTGSEMFPGEKVWSAVLRLLFCGIWM